MQVLITAITNANTNDPTLPRRYTAALKALLKNNVIITPSDKSEGVVIIDLTQYNNKPTELLERQKHIWRNYTTNHN